MKNILLAALTFAFTFTLLEMVTVHAGGWSVITLDAGGLLDPTDAKHDGVSADQPFIIGFTVLQHGITPLADLSPTITLRHEESGEEVVVIARPEGTKGHYIAEITLPRAGNWAWEIAAFGAPAAFNPIDVRAPRAALPAAGAYNALPGLLAATTIAAGAILFIALRARRRPRMHESRPQ
ncbi:hypothetical protein HC891_08945 [Candidatus Gracilibacteria bacterium]|nr:hypothetical protein [Candidatus Gracilibacteria bacterium]